MALIGDTVITIRVNQDHRGAIGEAEVTVLVDGMLLYSQRQVQKPPAPMEVRELEHAALALRLCEAAVFARTAKVKLPTKKAKGRGKGKVLRAKK